MEERWITDRIMELCRIRGWTVYRLAKESGITYSTLCTMLHKDNAPSVYTLVRLCGGFRITLAEFFDDGNRRAELSREQCDLLETWECLSEENRDQARRYMELLLRDQERSEA